MEIYGAQPRKARLCKAGLSNSHFKGRGTHVHHGFQLKTDNRSNHGNP